MKNILNNISHKLLNLLPTLAIKLAVASVETLCFFWTHQPDIPDELVNKIAED